MGRPQLAAAAVSGGGSAPWGWRRGCPPVAMPLVPVVGSKVCGAVSSPGGAWSAVPAAASSGCGCPLAPRPSPARAEGGSPGLPSSTSVPSPPLPLVRTMPGSMQGPPYVFFKNVRASARARAPPSCSPPHDVAGGSCRSRVTHSADLGRALAAARPNKPTPSAPGRAWPLSNNQTSRAETGAPPSAEDIWSQTGAVAAFARVTPCVQLA